METDTYRSGNLSPRLRKHIQARQAVILKEIDSLRRAPIILTCQIGRLKQEYNALVDERARLEPGPLSDPIERLPAELWPNIFKAEGTDYDMCDVVDILLDLTLVSRKWCRALLSTPVLWTDIVLDQSRYDYLAKAAMCIHLSGRYEIDVDISLLPESWDMASSLILPESKRIRSLRLLFDGPFAQKVLKEFGEMPALKELSLFGCVVGWRRPNEDDLDSLGLRRMPALQILRGQQISIDSESWRHLITFDCIDIVDAKKAIIEQYGGLPNFHTMIIQHIETPGHQGMVDPELYSRALDSSLSRVRSLTYHGQAFNQIVRWFGQNLTELNVGVRGIDSLQELALSLALLPGLNSLILTMSNPQFTNKSHIPVTPLSSITGLELFFTHGDWNDTQENWEQNAIMDSIFEGLVTIMPSVTSLRISRGILTEACFKYIEGLANLSGLNIDHCYFSQNYTVSLVAKNLRQLSWNVVGYCPTILTDINAPALRKLFIVGGYDGGAYDPFTISSSTGERSISACYAISGERFAKITSLTLGIVGPVHWELVSLSALKVLKLTSLAPGSMIWANDIIEGILMRPCDLPVLDTISFVDQFFEWDILLLMLERRILYSHLGISPIRTIIVPNQLPYKLLQPISTLLQGKLPEREPIDQFSLEAAAQRLCNAELAGCSACCYAFRHCDMRTIPGQNPNRYEGRIPLLSLENELPSEFVTADPPLTPDVTDWLLGKRSRRHALIQEYNRVAKSFHRVTMCHRYRPHIAREVTITGHSLDGVNFQESLEPTVD